MKVAIFGLGYVGLSTGIIFALKGHEVIGVDIDPNKVNSISRGKVPFYEPNLDRFLLRAIQSGKFKVTTDYLEAVKRSEIGYVCVPTPTDIGGNVNLDYLKNAVLGILKAVKRLEKNFYIIVVKSTVPPGTMKNFVKKIIEEMGFSVGINIGLAHVPEFLRTGSTLKDLEGPSRIVIGVEDDRSREILVRFYNEMYSDKNVPIIVTNFVNAEFIKYASNAFLSTKISFINEIARLAERFEGADVKIIAHGMGLDPRIGEKFLGAGLGFGGSCLPKDLRGFIKAFELYGEEPHILKATYKVNNEQPLRGVRMLEELVGRLEGKIIAVLGVAFKPNTDDIREAVSIKIIKKLLEQGARVRVYDPKALENLKKIFGNEIEYSKNVKDALKGAHGAILVTEWDEFKKLEPKDFKENMAEPNLVDGRRVYDLKKFLNEGVKIKAIGFGNKIK